MLRSRAGRYSRWSSPPFLVPKPLALVLTLVGTLHPENSFDPFKYRLPQMKIDPRRCSMLPASTFRGLWHQLALHGLRERECGILGRN
jgi:hypothetical protein